MAACLPRLRGGIDFLGSKAALENLGWGQFPFFYTTIPFVIARFNRAIQVNKAAPQSGAHIT
jgi:hypothetical protein